MDLLLIRHGIAAALAEGIETDAERPLTAKGAKRIGKVAERLARISGPPEAILTSPLLRARQTADSLARAWGRPSPTVAPALVGGDWDEIRQALDRFGNHATVALVGHEDWLSVLTARLLGSARHRAFAFRRGGVALLRIGRRRQARATLLWFIPPGVLRKL